MKINVIPTVTNSVSLNNLDPNASSISTSDLTLFSTEESGWSTFSESSHCERDHCKMSFVNVLVADFGMEPSSKKIVKYFEDDGNQWRCRRAVGLEFFLDGGGKRFPSRVE